MIGLILVLVIGFLITFITLHSTSGVTIILKDSTYPTIPLYFIAIGTYLIGLVVAWIIDIPSAMENVKLQGVTLKSIVVNKTADENPTPNFIHNLLHKLKSSEEVKKL